MKEPDNLIEFRERRIQSGKNARFYGSIFYFAVWTFFMIVEDTEFFTVFFIMFFFYWVMILLINIRLFNEKQKLSRLLKKQENESL